jgi:hypothetical protein
LVVEVLYGFVVVVVGGAFEVEVSEVGLVAQVVEVEVSEAEYDIRIVVRHLPMDDVDLVPVS